MFISARQTFLDTDPAWAAYIAWSGLADLREIRTIDRKLNTILPNSSSHDCVIGDYLSALRSLPHVTPGQQYYQLAINLSYQKPPTWIDSARFLGCDLADDTWRSALFNYGPWTGELKPLASHLNEFGLLRVTAATQARDLMARQWDRAFGFVDLAIWALYELPAQPPAHLTTTGTERVIEIH